MAEIGRPYLYRYAEDPVSDASAALGKPAPLRPVVPIALSFLGRRTPRIEALVDSGSERVLAAPSLGRALNLNLEDVPSVKVGIGGHDRAVRFATVHLELYENLLEDDSAAIADWDADVGFLHTWEPKQAMVLGRDGFLDRLTLTMHGGIPAFILEPWEAFDERFGTQIENADTSQPRFEP